MKKRLARVTAVVLTIAVVISSTGLAMAEADSDGAQGNVKVLAVRVPGAVELDESVTIAVTDREDGSPVPAVSVYALRWPHPGVWAFPGPSYGCEFLGKTDNDGEVGEGTLEAGQTQDEIELPADGSTGVAPAFVARAAEPGHPEMGGAISEGLADNADNLLRRPWSCEPKGLTATRGRI